MMVVLAFALIIMPVFLLSLSDSYARDRAWAPHKPAPKPEPEAETKAPEQPKPKPKPAARSRLDESWDAACRKRDEDCRMAADWPAQVARMADRELIAKIAEHNVYIEHWEQQLAQFAGPWCMAQEYTARRVVRAKAEQRVMYEEMISRRKQRKAKSA
jgi:hypothetical protein